MPEHPECPEPYAIQYSESGKESRKNLPPETMAAFNDILDTLAANPDAFPGRIREISRDGKVRLYKHPSPALEVTFEVDASRRVLFLFHFVAPKVQITKPVFISYSHQDAEWLTKLRRFLRPLEERSLIRVWDDTLIRPGSEWLDEIETALSSARVAVFLVTQNFLDSPFIRSTELPALLEGATSRGCLIFWIAVSSSTFGDSPLARIQGAIPPGMPLDRLPESEQNALFLQIYEKMRDAVVIQ
jgi:hypothetical protein